MKKLLYLFLAITIISCGGEDDGNSPQTFTERINGIVWTTPDPIDDGIFLGIYDNPEIIWFWGEITDMEDCYKYRIAFDGTPTGYGDIWTLVENTRDKLIIYNTGEQYFLEFWLINNDSQLNVEFIEAWGSEGISTYDRINSPNPCL